MLQKVFKSENSTVLALPEEMLDVLHLKEGEDVSVELDTEHRQIIITRLSLHVDDVADNIANDVDTEFARQVAIFIDIYRPALESLAK